MKKETQEKQKQMRVRLDESDYEKVLAKIKELGLSRQKYLSCAVVSKPIIKVDFSALSEVTKPLGNIENMLRELLLHYIELEDTEIIKEVSEVKENLEKIWLMLRELLSQKI